MSALRPALFRGWYVVAGSFAVLFCAFGSAYSFGAFFEPLSQAFGAPRAAVSAVFAWTTAGIFLTGAVSGAVADRYGPRLVVMIGIGAIAAGLLATARAESLRAVQIAFALGVGVGTGCVYVPPVGAVQRWFDRRRGLASGLAVTGVGLGTLVLPLAAGLLLEVMPWRQVLLVMAVFVLAVGLSASLWLSPEPAAHGLLPDGDAAGTPRRPPPAELPLRVLIPSRRFVVLYLANAALAIGMFMPFVHVVPSAMDAGVAREAAVLALGMIGAGSTLGRFALGYLADRWGRPRTMLAVFLGLALSYGVWWQAEAAAAFLAFGLLFGTCYGGYVAMLPALIADHFAGARLGAVIGLQYTAAGLAGLVGPVLAGYLYDTGGSYAPAFAVAAASSLAAAGLLAALPPPATAPAAPDAVAAGAVRPSR